MQTFMSFNNNAIKITWFGKLLALWVFLSAFYYVGNLLSGNLLVGQSEDFFSRIIKYLVSFGFLVAAFFIFRLYSLLILVAFFSVVLLLLILLWILGYSVFTQMSLLLIFISFSGLVYFFQCLEQSDVEIILDSLVLSAFVVSIISFYEYFFMWPVLGEYWLATGGYRSVSTLLNPNNLGMYLGAALVVVSLRDRFHFLFRTLLFVVIFLALIMSGSRTALVSLIVPVSLGLLFSQGFKVKVTAFLLYGVFFFCLIVAMFVFVLVDGVPDPSSRISDTYTASLRIEKYITYVTSIDTSYLLPDFIGERSYYVSESSYFYFINTFGIILLLFWLLVFSFLFRLRLASYGAGSASRVLKFLVLYYLIAFLFENMLASFPNNQLFFFALGSVLIPRKI